jgi:uncharacterized membrane protein YbhN (UPF0104 family)
LKKSLGSFLKFAISLGLGVLIIMLVANNFKKPLKIKVDKSQVPAESVWKLKQWNTIGDYTLVGDTLGWIENTNAVVIPILSIYEGEIQSQEIKEGESIASGYTIAKIKVDIWKVTRDAFGRANYWWLLLSVVLSMLSHMSRAIRWKMLYKPMGYHPTTGNAFGAVLVMYLSNLAFPRLGEVLRCTIINRYEKIPMSASVGTLITERAIDVFCLLLLMGACFLFQNQIFLDFYNEYMPESGGNLKFIILGAGFIGLILMYLLYKSGHLPFADKIKGMVSSLWKAVISIKDLENPILFLGHSIFIWTMYLLMTAVCFYALPETSNITLWAALPTLFFGGIAMVAVQGGLGLYPYFVSKILLMYGLAETAGYAFGWVLWTAQTTIVVIAGLIAYVVLMIVNKEKEVKLNVQQ